MAGNIVKWWKHKILGGYKQFSVQECATDSEELMYHQIRAPSSCSAPPDLLLVSDRENNIPLKPPVVNIISASSHPQPASQHKHPLLAQQQQHNHHNNHLHHQQQHPMHSTPKDVLNKTLKNSNKTQQPQCSVNGKLTNNGGGSNQVNGGGATVEQEKDERLHLEEFTCDVSVEGGKSSQPLQFSFTFYDLDGHHGKITKDDIVGIVYTIYESIGKSVVVPHCGSKTINVRLTVSPEGKSKTTSPPTGAGAAGSNQKFKKTVGRSNREDGQRTGHSGHTRRQHRYRPRKLVKTDDEDDDSLSDKDVVRKSFASSKTTKCCQQQPMQPQTQPQPEMENDPNLICGNGQCNIYENVSNLKEDCKSFLTHPEKSELYLKQASNRVKMLRKARKQKYQDQCNDSRLRSLSVGNESYWKTRMNNSTQSHRIQQKQQEHNLHHQHPIDSITTHTSIEQDIVDGNGIGCSDGHNIQTQPNNTSNATTAECWNNALNRNDLIDIIRESMEKNRLCFQTNGKPQANISPMRRRHRSNTISKIPTNSSNNNNVMPGSMNIDSPVTNHHHETTSHNYSHHHHHQPHVPIYHQQMAINPAVLAAQNGIVHGKTNLCGYDSFLHAKICSGGTNQSPPPPIMPGNAGPVGTQPVATVQPIMTNSPKIYVSNQIKTSKILRNMNHHMQQNSPQFHGYHLLSSGSYNSAKLNISVLNALSPNLSNQEKLHQTIEHVEKWLAEHERKPLNTTTANVDEKCKKDVKNYDNLLFAKLTEKLQQQQVLQDSGHSIGNKENIRGIHHTQNSNIKVHHRHKRNQQSPSVSQATPSQRSSGSSSNSSEKLLSSNKYVTLIPINGDPIECENLLHPTSDEESNTVPRTPSPPNVSSNVGGGEELRSTDSSSSLVHRYVHEHIHHHYHHFEDKEE